MKYYYTSLLFLIFFILKIRISCLEINFELPAHDKICFFENCKKDQFYRFDISSEKYFVNVEYKIPSEVMNRAYSTLIFKKSFTSSSEEEFKVCIYSTSDSKQSIKFNFASGINAKDFGDIISAKDLKPINDQVILNLFKVEEIERKVRDYQLSARFAEENAKGYKSLKEELGSFLKFWFIILSLSLFFIGLISYLYVQNIISSYKLK